MSPPELQKNRRKKFVPTVGKGISNYDRSWWERWFDILRQLNAVEIPMCLFPNDEDIVRMEIHGFGDASEEAHAAVFYLRHLFKSGEVVIR